MKSSLEMWCTTMALAVAASPLTAAPQNDRPAPGDHNKQVAKDKDQSRKQAHLLRASTLIGMDIHDASGNQIGDINNIAIDPNCACARLAIVSYGGAMGIGDTKVAVPLKAFRFDTDGKKATLDITKERLAQGPKFEDNQWDLLVDKNWNKAVHDFYSVKPDSDFQKPTDGADVQTLKALKGSEVVGMDVQNRQDEDLGEIEDVMIDVNSGRIAYAVLSFGGVLGVNEKLFAVPWRSFTINSNENEAVLPLDKEKLAQAPGFDKNQWPNMNDLNWSKDVHAFYGSDPNWVYGYTPTDDSKDRNTTGTGWGATSEYNRKFNSGAVQTVKGNITDVGNDEPMDGMSDATVLTIRTDRGETVIVHLGPQWFIENQDQKFNENEQVEVTGSRADFNGKPAIMATEVKRGQDVLRLRDKSGRPLWSAWHGANENRSSGAN